MVKHFTQVKANLGDMDRFGRIYVPDPRDHGYPVAAALAEEKAPTRRLKYHWDHGWWGDQQNTPRCVAYAWTHWLEDGPHTLHPKDPNYAAQHEVGASVVPRDLYEQAQTLDQWPGEDYRGTSVRGGAKALRAAGLISSFLWASEVEEVAAAVLTKGPVVVGTTWTLGMTYPVHDLGVLRIIPNGPVQGGHAYVVNGVNVRRKLFRIKNSWGRSWGSGGRAWITFGDLQDLLDDYGEACLPVV